MRGRHVAGNPSQNYKIVFGNSVQCCTILLVRQARVFWLFSKRLNNRNHQRCAASLMKWPSRAGQVRLETPRKTRGRKTRSNPYKNRETASHSFRSRRRSSTIIFTVPQASAP